MYLASTNGLADGINDCGRRVICAGRRKSSVMGRCLHAHTVSIIKQIASLLRLRRSAILPKGIPSTSIGVYMDADQSAAQNILRD